MLAKQKVNKSTYIMFRTTNQVYETFNVWQYQQTLKDPKEKHFSDSRLSNRHVVFKTLESILNMQQSGFIEPSMQLNTSGHLSLMACCIFLFGGSPQTELKSLVLLMTPRSLFLTLLSLTGLSLWPQVTAGHLKPTRFPNDAVSCHLLKEVLPTI